MKRIIILLFIILITGTTKSQNVGIGTSSPDSSTILELKDSSKGFLPPRMNLTQRNALLLPASGLIIYNTSSNGLECYNGTSWNSTAN